MTQQNWSDKIVKRPIPFHVNLINQFKIKWIKKSTSKNNSASQCKSNWDNIINKETKRKRNRISSAFGFNCKWKLAASKSKHRIFNSIWEAHNKTKSEQISMNEYHHFYCWMLLKCVSASCSRFFAGFNKRFFMQQPTRSFEEWGCHRKLRHVHYFNRITECSRDELVVNSCALQKLRIIEFLDYQIICHELEICKI